MKEFDAFSAVHLIKSGFELTRQIGGYEIPKTYVHNSAPKSLTGACEPGDKTCVIDDSFASQGAVGQYLSKKNLLLRRKNQGHANQSRPLSRRRDEVWRV